MVNQKLKILFEKAIEIENHSKSPRIISLHSKGKFCQVGLGTYYPESTKYMFVSLNPGGDYYLPEKQDAEKSSLEHSNFKQYLQYTFRYALNVKKIISAFANEKNISSYDSIFRFTNPFEPSEIEEQLPAEKVSFDNPKVGDFARQV